MERPPVERISLPPARQKSAKTAPEALLLFVLLLSLLVTMASMVLAHHPAAGIFAPLAESQSPNNR
jgi:hypothetical protein